MIKKTIKLEMMRDSTNHKCNNNNNNNKVNKCQCFKEEWKLTQWGYKVDKGSVTNLIVFGSPIS